MLCSKCEKNLTELNNDINLKYGEISVDYVCESCGQKFNLSGNISFPQEYHLTEPMEIVIKPKYSLLRDFCPICDINYKNDPNHEDFIIATGDMKMLDHSVDLIPLQNKTWKYQGYVYYYCKECKSNFKLPFKIKNINIKEK